MSRSRRAIGGALALAVVMLGLRPGTADACGGLFCNSAQPVNQAAERILFAENGDGSVTAVIEIQYQGPAESFSWVLPVPGVPEVDVSSVTAFDRLQQATNPSYTLNTNFEDCSNALDGIFGSSKDASGGASRGVADGAEHDVTVLAEGSVGPFIYEVIMVNPALADAADAALDWLTDNGYDVTDLGPEVLRPYLDDGLNLLAFKLTKTADTGSIRPIMITYESRNPFIPIRPTAVAANDDMGIMVWVVSASRAVPKNYKALELNEALIDWFNPMNTYNDVVSAAADEAGGQGFVTEFAGDGEALDEVIVRNDERSAWGRIQSGTFAEPLDLLQEVSAAFPGWDGLADALRAAVTLPSGVSFEDFAACPSCYEGSQGVVVDQDALLKELYEMVAKPMFDTDDLLQSQRYVTRLYTTMSADEMTIDPMFDFNPDLADLSNVHTADQYVKCDGTWNVTLPNGDVVYGDESGVWPNLGKQPAARKIVQLSTKGQGAVVEDNADEISNMLAERAPPEACGCRAPGATRRPIAIAPLAWLALAGVVARRGRRNRAPRPRTW